MKNTGMAAPTPMLIGGGRDHTKAPCRAVAATPIPPYFIFSNNYLFFLLEHSFCIPNEAL